MRTAVGLLSLLWLGGAVLTPASAPALAQIAPVAPPSSKTAADAKGAPTAGRAEKKDRKARRKGAVTRQASPGGRPPARQRCLDLWEPATHMTRREWARACSGLDERLTSVSLQ